MQNQFYEVEIFAEHKRADLQRVVEQSSLIFDIENANTHTQGWVANKMHSLSIWMMRTGERLHKRYHAPTHLPHLHQKGTQAR